MDYCCLSVPAEVGCRYPEPGAGAVMSRQANLADSFLSAAETRPETEQETKELSMLSPELRPDARTDLGGCTWVVSLSPG